MSFLEMVDVLNESLIKRGEDPIAFDSDCREGICGSCGVVINGVPHGPLPGVTTCQLYMRHFRDGDTVVVEPWRAKAFPVVKDLVVDRSAFDRIIAAGGFISVNTGSAPEANSLPVGKDLADRSMDAAACIGCGACVAACKTPTIRPATKAANNAGPAINAQMKNALRNSSTAPSVVTCSSAECCRRRGSSRRRARRAGA